MIEEGRTPRKLRQEMWRIINRHSTPREWKWGVIKEWFLPLDTGNPQYLLSGISEWCGLVPPIPSLSKQKYLLEFYCFRLTILCGMWWGEQYVFKCACTDWFCLYQPLMFCSPLTVPHASHSGCYLSCYWNGKTCGAKLSPEEARKSRRGLAWS